MARRACTFREFDLRRILRAARSAGVRCRIEIEPTGKMVVTPIKDDDAAVNTDRESNPWDKVYEKDQERPA